MNGHPGPAPGTASPERLAAASLARRMACFVYEGVLLGGVLMAAGLLYAVVAGQRDATVGRSGLQALVFFVLGLYFVWFWCHGGQTLAMKTWRIRLLRADGAPLSMPRALARYVLGWVWFVPALASLHLLRATSAGKVLLAFGLGVAGYAALTWLNPDRQFWHDSACGTRLVNWAVGRPR